MELEVKGEGIGWRLAYWRRNLQICFVDANVVTDESYASYIRAVAEDIDTAPPGKRAVFYRSVGAQGMSASRRRALGEVLDARREKLREITRAFAFVTPSTVSRGILQAIFWFAPPPYPHKVVRSSLDALEYLHGHDPELDVDSALAVVNDEWRSFELNPQARARPS